MAYKTLIQHYGTPAFMTGPDTIKTKTACLQRAYSTAAKTPK